MPRYHRIKDAPGGEIWMVAGHYEVRLLRFDGAWQIAGITLRVFYQEGTNPSLRSLVSARPQREG